MGNSRARGKGLTAFKAILFLLILEQLLLFICPQLMAADSKGIVRLTWTSPGDDLLWGRAARYDIRYSRYPITVQNWNAAIQTEAEPIPKPAGTSEMYIVAGLEMGTSYYFAIKTVDDANNWSALSNTIRVKSISTYICGDTTADQKVGVSDVVVLINYIFLGGDAPRPLAAGDADCSGSVNISDATYLLNYVFSGGKAPCDLNADGSPDC